MKTFYYKNKTLIKYIMVIISIILFISVPTIFLFVGGDIERTAKVKDPDFAWETPPTQSNLHLSEDGSEYLADWNFQIDMEALNGWKVDDYIITVGVNNISNFATDGEGNELLWVPQYKNTDEIIDSIAYDGLGVENMDKPDQEMMINKLSNAPKWNNDSSVDVKSISEFDPVYNIFVQAELSYKTDDGLWMKDKIYNYAATLHTTRPSGSIAISSPTLNDYTEGGDFNKLFTEGGNSIHAEEVNMNVNPIIGLSELNDPEVYEVLPNVDIEIYSDEGTIIKADDVQYDKLKNGFAIPQFKIPSYFYDENNLILDSLNNDSIKIKGNLNYKFKSQEEIENTFVGKTIDWTEGTEAGKEYTINFDNGKGYAVSADTHSLFSYLKFNKSLPDTIIYPGWDKNGIFSVNIATNDKFVFNIPGISFNDYEIVLDFEYRDKYGEVTSMWLSPTRISYGEYNGEQVFTSNIESSTQLSSKSDYYIDNNSYIEQRSTNDDWHPSNGIDRNKIYILNNPIIEIMNVSDVKDGTSTLEFPEGKSILLLPDNIKPATLDHTYEKEFTTNVLIILVIIAFVLPILLQISIKLYRKFK